MVSAEQLELFSVGKFGHINRTEEHEQWERESADMGIPYPEPIRTLLFSFDGIRYQIADAILSWRVLTNDCLCCMRCGQLLKIIAPNLLHSVPMAMCECRAAFMEPLDPRDRGLLELAHPISEKDRRLGEQFARELRRLHIKETAQ
jgi:hypothetical protein